MRRVNLLRFATSRRYPSYLAIPISFHRYVRIHFWPIPAGDLCAATDQNCFHGFVFIFASLVKPRDVHLITPHLTAGMVQDRPLHYSAHAHLNVRETIMNVVLKLADRSNWRTMLRLQLNSEQQGFVSPPAWSLARCYVRFFGDEFEHLPHLIYAGDQAVGYSTTACNPVSENDYWIDDIMIDAPLQGCGYGRAAVIETVKMIVRRYRRCRAVQLTCFRANSVAARLYVSLGFLATGQNDDEFGEPNYQLAGAALDVYRES